MNRRRFLRNFAASVVAFVAIVAGEGALPAQITGEETATKPKWLNDQSVTPVSHCAGKWIWCEGAEADQRDVYVFVRGEVALDGGIKAARLHVSAEDRYLLYLNGNYLGRGPARSLPKLKSYDTYDVGARLKKGRNVIAIRAYHYGFGDLLSHGHNYASGARAGIWSQLEVQSDNGAMHRFGSGDTWKMRPARGWARNVGLISTLEGTSFTEVLNGGLDPLDWMTPGFDDAAWEKAVVISKAKGKDAAPWENMEARYTPLMAERLIYPNKIVTTAEVLDNLLSGNVTELLRTEIHLPPEHVRIEDEASLLNADGGGAVVASAFREIDGVFHPVLIFDFGRQIFGFPQVTLTAPKGVVVDTTYSQRLLGGRIHVETTRRVNFGDRYITREGRQTWRQAEYKQFRYLQIVIRSYLDHIRLHTEPVKLHAVACNQYYYPAEQKGSFECSDPLLAAAWQAAVDTAYLETEDVMVCDAWRERACHMDTESVHWPVKAMYAGYGDLAVFDRKLLLSTQAANDSGFINLFFPPKEISQLYNSALLWSSSIKDHLLYTGRREVTTAVYPFLRNLMRHYATYLKEDNLLHFEEGQMVWTDSSLVDNRSPAFTVNAYYVMGLEDAAWVASELGKDADAEKWMETAKSVRQAVKGAFWNEEKGLFADSCWNGSQTGIFSEITNSLALNIGIADKEQAARIAGHFRKQDVGWDRPTPMCTGSVVEGLLQAGFADEAIQVMKRYRPMLECEENPTFWEGWGPCYTGGNTTVGFRDWDVLAPERGEWLAYRPTAARSRTHGSGAMIALVLHQQILGVVPTAPGFRKCRIEPKPGNLIWAKGKVPTPQGNIRVEWRMEKGKLKVKADLPDGVERE